MVMRLLKLWIIAGCMAVTTGVWAAAGTVQVVLGQARIIQSTGQERAAIKGDQVYTGDTITTAASGQVQVRMIDDARLWVRPNSRLLIEQYPADAAAAQEPRAQTATRLLEGGLRAATGAIGQRSPDKVRLSTPNAVIGIRGTELELAFFPARMADALQTPAGTYHRVYEGRTRVSAPGTPPLDVLAGQAVFVSLKPGEPPRVLPQIPPFLNLPDGPVASPVRADTAAAARSLKIGLRMASPMADGAVVTSSAGAPASGRAGAGSGAGRAAWGVIEPDHAAGHLDGHQWARLLAVGGAANHCFEQRAARIGSSADTGRHRPLRCGAPCWPAAWYWCWPAMPYRPGHCRACNGWSGGCTTPASPGGPPPWPKTRPMNG